MRLPAAHAQMHQRLSPAMRPMARFGPLHRPAQEAGRQKISKPIISKAPERTSVARSADAAATEWPSTSSSGGGGAGNAGVNGTGGGDGHDGGYSGQQAPAAADGSSGDSHSAAAILLAAGRALDSLPVAVANAVKEGTVRLKLLQNAAIAAGHVYFAAVAVALAMLPDDAEAMQRYLEIERNFFLKFWLKFGGTRERLLGDPNFPIKVAIEVGIGITMKILAELNKRGDNFKAEIDFVFANCVMAVVADFMLTWLPAPRYTFGQSKAAAAATKPQSGLQKWFAGCPDNAFQVVPAGREPFTLGQRAGAVARNGVKLLGVGFGSSVFGVAVTNSLMAARQMLDKNFHPPNQPQGVIITSIGYGTFMAWNSNLRYQLIAGVVEERGIEKMFGSSKALCAALSFAVRTGNTFLGSSMWIDYLRFTGLQPKTPVE